MDESHKEDQLRRHLKGAARRARRTQRESYQKAAGASRPASRGQAQDDEGWDDARPQRRNRRPKQRRQPRAKGGSTPEPLAEALLTSLARGHARVRRRGATEDELAQLSPALGQAQLAVGDRVLLRESTPPRIEEVLPRTSLLSRPDVSNPHRELPIAANLDLGVIVAACVSPPLRPGLIDRYLIALERSGVAPILCINKVDLCKSTLQREQLERELAPYLELGVPVLRVSTTAAPGVTQLAQVLRGQTAVLVGHSGVGKSSLLGALGAASEHAIPGAVRAYDGRGRHTTSASILRDLPGDVRLIDTPGVRAFGLWGVSRADLSRSFPGLGEAAGRCRFGDCSHVSEPDCEVLRQVEGGLLSRARYAIYRRLLEELRS